MPVKANFKLEDSEQAKILYHALNSVQDLTGRICSLLDVMSLIEISDPVLVELPNAIAAAAMLAESELFAIDVITSSVQEANSVSHDETYANEFGRLELKLPF